MSVLLQESETSETVSSSRLTRTLTIEKIVSFDGEPVVRQQPAIDQENPGSSLQGDTEHLTSFHQTSILSVPTKSEGGDGGSEALGLASSVGQVSTLATGVSLGTGGLGVKCVDAQDRRS